MRACVRACVRCLPRHVAIAIDLSDVSSGAKERGNGDGEGDGDGDGDKGGFRQVAIFSLFSVYSSKG